MTRLSRCDLRRRSRVLLRPMVLFRSLTLLALLISLGLVEVHLRFLVRDLQIESQKLQAQRSELLNRQRMLVSEVESQKAGGAIERYAMTELGMEYCRPEQRRSARVAEGSVKRWQEMSRSLALADAASHSNNENLLETLGERMLILSSVSMARDR
ncbi:cell division protein FtsL [bacterium]|nr:cell division protein FtsL [bacterium]